MSLSFNHISHTYQDTQVLNDLSLTAQPGQITCLLGPSGGGKSTLLRLAAGLGTIQTGQIELNGELLASSSLHPPPEKRPIGLMFQDNALFPHMRVSQNIAFGLAGIAKQEQAARVQALLEMAGMPSFAKRYPHELSGGEQQRIALLRSLAPQPQVILMDEPYASIDITLRRTLREAARQTLKQSETTTILVTHDPSEAMEMADEMSDEMTDEEMEAVSDQMQELSAVMPDKEMEEEMPEAADEWSVAASGTFVGADAFHQGSGTATIFQQGDTRVLRFEDFEVTNGPDLHVLLVENLEGDMGNYVDLGSLKGNVGSQNYEIPDDLDLSQFAGVMIYCQPFHVNFATAGF